MSGGHFDYKQHAIDDIAHDVDYLIRNNSNTDKDLHGCMIGLQYRAETIKEFNKAYKYLRLAAIYAQRIDWLVSGDDGEDDFHKRLAEDTESEFNVK